MESTHTGTRFEVFVDDNFHIFDIEYDIIRIDLVSVIHRIGIPGTTCFFQAQTQPYSGSTPGQKISHPIERRATQCNHCNISTTKLSLR